MSNGEEDVRRSSKEIQKAMEENDSKRYVRALGDAMEIFSEIMEGREDGK